MSLKPLKQWSLKPTKESSMLAVCTCLAYWGNAGLCADGDVYSLPGPEEPSVVYRPALLLCKWYIHSVNDKEMRKCDKLSIWNIASQYTSVYQIIEKNAIPNNDMVVFRMDTLCPTNAQQGWLSFQSKAQTTVLVIYVSHEQNYHSLRGNFNRLWQWQLSSQNIFLNGR